MTIVRHEVACGSCSHFSGGNHQYHLMNVHPLDGEIKSNDATDRVTQGVSRIPPDTDQDDVDRKTHSFEAEHGRPSTVMGFKVYLVPLTAPLMRQNLQNPHR